MPMLPTRIMRETVTVTRPSMVDARGTSVPDWGAARTHTLSGVSVQEKDGSSDMAGRDAATSMASLYAKPDADIRRGDRIEAHGRTWTVTGEPRRMGVGMFLNHIVANLQEWEG